MINEIATVEPSVAVHWGDWCYLPETETQAEGFVCLSPGSHIREVRFWPDSGPDSRSLLKMWCGDGVGEFYGAQADALRDQLLRRLPVVHGEEPDADQDVPDYDREAADYDQYGADDEVADIESVFEALEDAGYVERVDREDMQSN